MLCFPNAKINLGLHILRKRSDGFHDIESVMYPVQWCDALEIIPAGHFSLNVSGADPVADFKNNLCYKAFDLLQREYAIPGISCYLHKEIPTGAGLGGGSSDAAFMLQQLNRQHKLNISPDDLARLAAGIGSDCPFFIYNKPMTASGRGDVLTAADVSLKEKYILIVKPEVSMNTAEAYSLIKPRQPDLPLKEIIKLPVEQWKYAMVNDFESIAFSKFPELSAIKRDLYQSGAVYASMSGSGTAFFGIFKSPVDYENIFNGLRCRQVVAEW